MSTFSVKIIGFYKLYISPFLVIIFGHSCRFTPTCSDYGKEAIGKYGFMKGLYLTTKRIIRCNPFVSPGYDPLV